MKTTSGIMLLIVHPLAVCLFAVVGVNYYSSQSERPRTSCSCGWEDRVRRGIQEGYISILNEKGYGFISEDSQGRGLFFHQSDLKGAISWVQLCRGMCVHFKVDENEKGCIAREVSVMARQGIRTPSVPVMNLPHSFPMPGPFDNQR